MKKLYKIILALLFFTVLICLSMNYFYIDTIDSSENTLVISQCTANMRALETGVSSYAGYKQVPFILSDKKIPAQLANWLPGYISRNNITKIIVIGSMDADELVKLRLMGVEVKQIHGNSISEILTKMADNTEDKNNDTVIFTASDPLAGLLGAYMKAPVFVTAANSSYASSEKLDENYLNYLKSHDIKNIIVVGSLPDNIMNQLNQYDATVEILSGQTTSQVSIAVNDKLKNEGYINSTEAYYGFYGEIPAAIPLVVKNHAYLMEDSSFDNSTIDYLKNNSVDTVHVTRNTESDYIQMEETDYISSDIIKNFEDNGFKITFLTNNRTLDEATGLYDLKINMLESMTNSTSADKSNNTIGNQKSKPPLLSMLDKKHWVDSNNISVEIENKTDSNYTVKWSTIHPYTWVKYNDSYYYATSNTGYEYYWVNNNGLWMVDYKYQNKSYYNITWIENDDNSWTEIQKDKNYTWCYDGNNWYCYDENQSVIYNISSIQS